MIRIKSTPILPAVGPARHPFIAVLASEEPLGRRMLEARTQRDPRTSQLSCALLAALLGEAEESEADLIRASGDCFGRVDPLVEAAWAFVLVETGHPARAPLHLDRARDAQGASGIASHATVLLLLKAQALLAGSGVKAARAAAAEARGSLVAGEDSALRIYASIVCASLALEDGDLDAAGSDLATAPQGSSGILAARIDVLRSRLHFARTGDAHSAALDLDRAINRLAVLGALRDLALAYLERALQAGADPGGAPGRWLARAQSLFASAGGKGQPLYRPPAPLEQRLLQGTFPATGQQPSAPLAETALMGELAAATHELCSLEEYDDLIAAIPRLALAVCAGKAARLVMARDDGLLETIAASGTGSAGQPASAALVQKLFSARGAEASGPIDCEGVAIAVVGPRDERLALVVERDAIGPSIGERDGERLSLYASFAAVSLARARARLLLREAASRDAVTLDAVCEGVLVLDRSGRVRSLNQSGANILGVHRGETMGRTLRDLPGLAPLASALKARPGAIETVQLEHGPVALRTHAHDGGVVVILRDPATEHAAQRRVAGSTARFTFDLLIGEDPVFAEVVASARRAAISDLPILITGESGTGKELLAQAIHNASGRSAAPFVGVNVTAIPRDLVESELFGYEGGTFTGARASGKAGKFELAGRGTLLLDEIGDMPPELQGKLLRVLQEKFVQRLGSGSDVPVRARVVATTHRDLEEAVALGHFRLDLYHRLKVVHLQIPPLRARRGDILPIARHQLSAYAERTKRRPITLSPAVAAAFEQCDWPGNIRELCNVVESEVSLLPAGESVLTRIPQALQQPVTPRPAVRSAPGGAILSLDELERRACSEALQRCGGNVTRAAQALGVAKNTLYAKMRRFGLGPFETARATATEALLAGTAEKVGSRTG